MTFTSVYSLSDNTLEVFFEESPLVCSLDEVELALTETGSAHELLTAQCVWVPGLFFGKDTFAFDVPLVTRERAHGLASGALCLWCRMKLKVVSEDSLRRCWAVDPAPDRCHDPCAQTTAEWTSELAFVANVGGVAVVLSGVLPRAYGALKQPCEAPLPFPLVPATLSGGTADLSVSDALLVWFANSPLFR